MKLPHKLISLPFYYKINSAISPWISTISLLLISYGIYLGLFNSPIDYQQSDCVRIIYLHVPAAFLSLSIYCIIGCSSAVYLIWHIKLADIIACSSIGIGCTFTIIALLTGSLWGKPMWGTWWIWDARLTSEFILLLLYIGLVTIRNTITDKTKAAKLCAILAIIGTIDIPIIHFSVNWWYTLHQGSTLANFRNNTIDASMLKPLLICLAGFYSFYFAMLLKISKTEIMLREKNANWLYKVLEKYS